MGGHIYAQAYFCYSLCVNSINFISLLKCHCVPLLYDIFNPIVRLKRLMKYKEKS